MAELHECTCPNPDGQLHRMHRAPCVNADSDVTLRQVWCVVYDNDTPSMDGKPTPIRMSDQPLDWAQRNYDVVVARSARSPKRNLRIETRFVSDYQVYRPERKIE